MGQDLYSAAHFGFANEDRSSTGFKNTSGSMSFLDVAYKLNPELNLGMRTLMQGGQQHDFSYYRMGSGPMISWQPSTKWLVHASYTLFNETALDETGEKAYGSKGRSMMLGWEKAKKLARSVEIVYGSFFIQHEGEINLASAISQSSRSRFANVEHNSGLTHGVEIALRMFF